MTALGSDGSMYEGSRRSVIGHLPARVSADDVALVLVALAACRIGHRPAGRRKAAGEPFGDVAHPLHRLTVTAITGPSGRRRRYWSYLAARRSMSNVTAGSYLARPLPGEPRVRRKRAFGMCRRPQIAAIRAKRSTV
jgi:hypothetical protein